MSELRQNLATKEWVIIATERAKRPEEFKSRKEKKELPAFNPACPFCPGNESNTPGETLRISDDGGWKVRSFPNKFAALSKEGERRRKIEGIERWLNGVGIHEVIAETPLHNLTTALLPVENIELILGAYRARYLDILNDPRIELIIIFKNHGEAAGTSLEHPHSQLIATPVVPTQVRNRLEDAMRYFDDTGECVYCKMMAEEIKAKERILIETEHFISFVLYAALSPFHTWILPKRHTSSFGDITDEEIKDMAGILKNVLARFYYGLDDPNFNYVIRSAPTGGGVKEYFHWYLSIVPRLTKTAGFELGSGMFINISMPEDNAKFLREVRIPK
ncbi:galactose-1-phosphate uridylyltransferase [Candidatus Desantisbacteria bacterium CG1_02_38_46]|uniref:Galactose-1-phosphate uridylyltransferase n=3 Tax=unclassified Candidatus Desantisiibacteriota TaxID=3106372 RepID=A0A2H9PCX6_9BACT|nr:MAG: galactose-1-phosphate uridylyltransferase [Candidatus Desantisbacteria bacterium CG1_02_38_46]PIU52125.1 MAG: galactose-1-phosphate uridylyltransferase [Candidatus Desantisbacteria bacterium CG07_land_8_20_14_0_80_39_15]PIZ17220.1 MAG: galactose-1-phosphate uridylyltransferase [Candidatus Desantisbacteria bacterium CG_4_10_14_0_8_um_filter_39_17]